MIVRRAGSSSTLRKTFLARHIDYAKRVLEKYTHNEPSVALKILNQEGYHRRRTRIEATIAMSTSWWHNHHRHRPFHDLGVALRSRDQTQSRRPLHDLGAALRSRDPTPAAAKPQSRRLRFRRACQHNQRRHRPLHDLRCRPPKQRPNVGGR